MAHVRVSPSRGLKLFGREIIFEEFQPVWSWYLNVTHGQTIYDRNTTLCTKVHRAVKIAQLHQHWHWQQKRRTPNKITLFCQHLAAGRISSLHNHNPRSRTLTVKSNRYSHDNQQYLLHWPSETRPSQILLGVTNTQESTVTLNNASDYWAIVLTDAGVRVRVSSPLARSSDALLSMNQESGTRNLHQIECSSIQCN